MTIDNPYKFGRATDYIYDTQKCAQVSMLGYVRARMLFAALRAANLCI